MENIVRSIVLKYKLENIPGLTPLECEETVMIIRYLIQRCEQDDILKELQGYLIQLEAKLEEKLISDPLPEAE